MAVKKKNIDKNQKKAFMISIVSHGLLLMLFFMIAAWTEPDPPIPEYGIELAFVGQPAKSISAKNTEKNEPVEETIPEPPVEEQQENIEDNTAEVIENTESTEIENVDENSPDVMEGVSEEASTAVLEEEQPEETIEETQEQEENIEETENSTEQELEEIDSIQENVEEDLPELDDRAIFNNDGTAGTDTGGGSNISGPSLDMSGWQWDYKPKPDDKSTENGKIIFQVTVDNEGEIIAIKTIEKTVSPIVEKVYKNAVMELTFSKTANNKSAAANSTGRITFIIQSK